MKDFSEEWESSDRTIRSRLTEKPSAAPTQTSGLNTLINVETVIKATGEEHDLA